MQQKKLNLDNYIIFCIYEGNAEKEILNCLLDNDLLLFTRKNLLEKKLHRRASVKALCKHLNYTFDKPVKIIRVIDSKNEKLVLPKPYKEMYGNSVINCITNPEIEILLIIAKNDYEKFKKQELKPSSFCKKEYNYNKKADTNFFTNNLTAEEIVSAIKKHNQMKQNKSQKSICYLLK